MLRGETTYLASRTGNRQVGHKVARSCSAAFSRYVSPRPSTEREWVLFCIRSKGPSFCGILESFSPTILFFSLVKAVHPPRRFAVPPPPNRAISIERAAVVDSRLVVIDQTEDDTGKQYYPLQIQSARAGEYGRLHERRHKSTESQSI